MRTLRRAGVPLAGFLTSDPRATIKGCVAALNGTADELPIICWDAARNWKGLNEAGQDALAQWFDPLSQSMVETLNLIVDNMPKGSVVFIMNPHRCWDMIGFAQGIWNMRDEFKTSQRTLILVGPEMNLPQELKSDAVIFSEPAPSRGEVKAIADKIIRDVSAKAGPQFKADGELVTSAAVGLLSSFDVEQSIALSVERTGIDPANVWERKIERIKKSTGAEIKIKNPTFDALVGCDNIRGEMLGFLQGRSKPGVVLHVDEIEKWIGGAGTDLSGVSTSLYGMFLTYTAEREVKGFCLAGIPGAGKSHSAACFAGTCGVPLVSLKDTKGSLVGESENRLRSVFNSVDALAGDGQVVLVATCNWVDNIPPDLMARFTMGTFFYDFPSEAERAALWKYYMKRYELPEQALPASENWVGREINVCCWRAWNFNRSLVDVAKNIVPSCVSQKAKLEQLRNSCSGRFVSASNPGVFRVGLAKQADASRSIDF